jgi:hypothetical protein
MAEAEQTVEQALNDLSAGATELAVDVVKGLGDVADAAGNALAAVTTGVGLFPEQNAVDPSAVVAAMPSEPVCPSLPGIIFPELPDLEQLGEIADDALEKVGDLVERLKNPPSAGDTTKEFASGVSSAADKAAKALGKVALDLENQIKDQAAAAWDSAVGQFNDLEAALEAVRSGAIDLSSLGVDILSLPADALAGAFAGFKNAAECLTGVAGGAEEAFNKKSAVLSEGLSKGRGLSATAADEAITQQSEETTDENGNTIKKQKTISRDDAAKSVAGTTKNAVPQSDSPLVTEKVIVKESDKVNKIGIVGLALQFYTKSGRKITPEEEARAFSGLPPKFSRPPLLLSSKSLKSFAIPPAEEGDSLDVLQAKFDAFWNDFQGPDFSEVGTPTQRRQEKLRLSLVKNYEDRGDPVPAKFLTPIKMTKVDIPHSSWYKLVSWHAASYNLANPPGEIDNSQVGGSGSKPLIGSTGKYYYWFNGEIK